MFIRRIYITYMWYVDTDTETYYTCTCTYSNSCTYLCTYALFNYVYIYIYKYLSLGNSWIKVDGIAGRNMNCAKKKCDFAPKQRGMSEKNMDISSTNIRIYEQRQTMSTRQGIKAAKFWEFKQHKRDVSGFARTWGLHPNSSKIKP